VAQEFHWKRVHLWSEKGTLRPTVGLGAPINSVTLDMLQRVWSELDYRIDVCQVTRGAHWVCVIPHETMSLCNCSHQFCKNIPVSFDFITTWNQGVFLCSPCVIVHWTQRGCLTWKRYCVSVLALCDKYCCPSCCGISSWDSIGIMITVLQDGRSGFDSWQGQESFLFSRMPRLNLGFTQPLIWWV